MFITGVIIGSDLLLACSIDTIIWVRRQLAIFKVHKNKRQKNSHQIIFLYLN